MITFIWWVCVFLVTLRVILMIFPGPIQDWTFRNAPLKPGGLAIQINKDGGIDYKTRRCNMKREYTRR